MTSARSWLLAGALLALSGPPLCGAPPEEKKEPDEVSYYRDVRTLFQQHCQGCHQPAKPMGGYVMTEHGNLFKKGDRDRPGVVAGQPDRSLLVEMVVAHGGKAPEMP